MKFKVEINFTKEPSYSTTVYALSATEAKTKATAEASLMGWNSKVKKYTVKRVESEAA